MTVNRGEWAGFTRARVRLVKTCDACARFESIFAIQLRWRTVRFTSTAAASFLLFCDYLQQKSILWARRTIWPIISSKTQLTHGITPLIWGATCAVTRPRWGNWHAVRQFSWTYCRAEILSQLFLAICPSWWLQGQPKLLISKRLKSHLSHSPTCLKKAYLLSKKYAKNALENKKINSLQMALGYIQAPFFYIASLLTKRQTVPERGPSG